MQKFMIPVLLLLFFVASSLLFAAWTSFGDGAEEWCIDRIPQLYQLPPGFPGEGTPQTGTAARPVYLLPPDLQRQLEMNGLEAVMNYFSTPMETVGQNTTSIGRKRLEQLLEVNAFSVMFEKEGISVEIPCAALRKLALTQDDMLVVTIEPVERGVFFWVTAGGKTVTPLPNVKVYLPAQKPASGSSAVWDESGTVIAHAVWESEALAVFTIQNTGLYSLGEPLSERT